MLNNAYTMCILHAKKDIDYSIDCYKRRLEIISSYEWNTKISPSLDSYQKILQINGRIDNLRLLHNISTTAINLLAEQQKTIIKSIFVDRLPKEKIIADLGIDESRFKYLKRASFAKLSYFFHVLGLTDARFIKLYNDEPLIIRNYKKALSLIRLARNKEARKPVYEGH